MQKEFTVPDIYSGVFRCKGCGQEIVGRFVRALPVCPICKECRWDTVQGGKKVDQKAIVLETSSE
jgi:RNA polymerase-binding transcription factor DksA